VTAPFDGDTQPLAGRQAVIVASRGGVYDEGTPTADWDHAVPVLKLILGNALGMSVSVISTSLTLAEVIPARVDDIPRSERELAAAHTAAADLGRQLGARES
jgi:FMN-dependent NADH-azoreductase